MFMVVDWWSVSLGVIGVIATVVFGIWAVLLVKRPKYPGQVTFFREGTIRLLDDVTGNLQHLTVSYKGEPVKKNLGLFKGFLVNTGTKDITDDMIEKPLTFQLSDECRWLEVSAKASSDGTERVKIIDAKTVEFSLGLFRRNEFLRFEALVESSGGPSEKGKIVPDHRIADTDGVYEKKMPMKGPKIWPDFYQACGAFFAILVFLSFLAYKAKGNDRIPALVMLFLFLCLMCFTLSTVYVRIQTAQKIRKLLQLDSD
jgi:hypothetical protein